MKTFYEYHVLIEINVVYKTIFPNEGVTMLCFYNKYNYNYCVVFFNYAREKFDMYLRMTKYNTSEIAEIFFDRHHLRPRPRNLHYITL